MRFSGLPPVNIRSPRGVTSQQRTAPQMPPLRFSFAPTRKVKTARQRQEISLNAAAEAEDEKQVNRLLRDEDLKEKFYQIFIHAIDSGTDLFEERIGLEQFRSFCRDSGISSAKSAKDAKGDWIQFGNIFEAIAKGQTHIGFHPFIRALCHVAFFALPDLQGEHQAALRAFIKQYIDPWIAKLKELNSNDGFVADVQLSKLSEVDRLLYIYETPLIRLWRRYRDWDTHTARTDLPFEEITKLDQYIEMDEMKACARELGLFPKYLSYVEILRCLCIVHFGFYKEEAEGERVQTPHDDDESSPEGSVPVRGKEEQWPALPRSEFFEALVRIAQIVYGKPPFSRKLPSIVSRCEAMMRGIEPYYNKIFPVNLLDECDFDIKGIPSVTSIQPKKGGVREEAECTVYGYNFCEKRGVYVTFGNSPAVRAHVVTPRMCKVLTPQVQPDKIIVNMRDTKPYVMEIWRTRTCHVEASNNGTNYTSCDPPLCYLFEDALPPFEFSEVMTNTLRRIFIQYCSQGDKYNTSFLNAQKWDTFKRDYDISEPVLEFVDAASHLPEKNLQPFFDENSELHNTKVTELSVDFVGFLKLLVQVLVSTHTDPLEDLLNDLLNLSRRPPPPTVRRRIKTDFSNWSME